MATSIRTFERRECFRADSGNTIIHQGGKLYFPGPFATSALDVIEDFSIQDMLTLITNGWWEEVTSVVI